MLQLQPVHWTVIVAFLVGLATVISSLTSWAEALRPAFIGGVLLQVAAFLKTLYTHSPGTYEEPEDL